MDEMTKVKDWLGEQLGLEIGDDTPLSDMLDSLLLVRLILKIEELSGKQIDDLAPKNFETLRAIEEAFFM